MCAVRAEVAVIGLGNDKHETPQICLLVKKQELERILGECAPDFICAAKPVKSHKAGLAASLCFYALLSLIIAAVVYQVYTWLSVAVVLVGVIFAVFSYRNKTVAADDSVFSYSRGLFSIVNGYFKYDSIQTAQFKSNAFLKRKAVGKICISILSAGSVSLHTTGWFDKSYYDALVDKLGY